VLRKQLMDGHNAYGIGIFAPMDRDSSPLGFIARKIKYPRVFAPIRRGL
jgi:hypothetical protein